MTTASPTRIIECVCAEFRMTKATLTQKTNRPNVVFPRQIAAYLLNKDSQNPRQVALGDRPGISYPMTGKLLGGKHHTTILHSVQKIEALLTDPDIGPRLQDTLSRIRENYPVERQILGPVAKGAFMSFLDAIDRRS